MDATHITPPRAAANDNKTLLMPGWSPEDGLAACRRAMAELRAEHRRTGRLLSDPKRRALLTEFRAFEACLLWRYFRSE